MSKKVTPITILAKAEEILQRPNNGSFGWAKGTLARTKQRKETAIDSAAACKFCAIGAIERAGFELGLGIGTSFFDEPMPVAKAKQRLKRVMANDFYGIADANDDPRTTFPQVLNAFSLARTSAGDE